MATPTVRPALPIDLGATSREVTGPTFQTPPYAITARSSSLDITAKFPQFERVDLSKLAQAATRGDRFALALEFIKTRNIGIVPGIAGLTAYGITAAGSQIYYSASLSIRESVVAGILGGVLGLVLGFRIDRTLDRLSAALSRPGELLQEAKNHGLVCGECSYPIVDLPCCPECGPATNGPPDKKRLGGSATRRD